MQKPIQVFLVDDHQIIIDGIKALLRDTSDIEVVGEANSGLEALKYLPAHEVDIVLMDVDMPGMDGRESTEQIITQFPTIRIIALSMHREHGIITAMSRAGCSGYLVKNSSQEEVITAIRTVFQGRPYFSGEVTQTLLERNNSIQETVQIPANLTSREKEILCLVAEGHSNTEIGEKLHISHRTVDTHRTNLMKKLQVKNIAGLIRYAFKHGFIS